ncbi:hypothetical protein [Hymenobacter antarcticus]|uniref:Uncharacterized protein n=1 Tax=Hymenobacter antarcticus TaxID=486270 RepID=A0ABP7NZL2_9BACT
MSPTPELPEPGRPNLRRALNELPVPEPAADLWARIEAQLPPPVLSRAVAQLPVPEPADDLWNAIAARLDAPAEVAVNPALPARPVVVRPLWPLTTSVRRLAALAASVLLAVVLLWNLRPGPAARGPRETLAYSQETVVDAPSPAALPSADPVEAEGRAFIDAHCQAQPAVCQSPDFQSLHSQLLELETEEQGLARYTRQHGNSPELVRHQVQVTTLKATVTRELIRLLIS